MADFIPIDKPIQRGIKTPLTLTQLQNYVAGFIQFIETPGGDIVVVNEASLTHPTPLNSHASLVANTPIHGDAVICSPEEIA